ncbi:Lantibiotic biosynthesis dihydropyridinesynthase TsrD family [Lactiplantibacillus plantarum]|uniref:lantibiotic dehydratase C-terminal domain-containing protein n=1 Tax=Lactiplantibacillus plantarum TaxID=1590 RepID=UPI0007B54ED4|nr:lantibiotic dehydratase C-terminal domain-containing protein [Lactiplantibacillus plantarum]KZU81086.1 Lantibiotic biosynthesis dihydropyridinesynthase TsrD family [Lactiplantibacillus plantarum]
MNEWHSLHIFVRTNELQDALIIYLHQEIQKLKKENNVNKWFFIRYWEGGPHVRFRYQGHYDESKMIKNITAFLKQKNEQEVSISRQQYYENINISAEGFTSIDELPWFKQGEVVSISYEPEILRYGGDKNIILSEQVFDLSSEITTQIILYTRQNFSLRFLLSVYVVKNLIKKMPDKLFPEGKFEFLQFCLKSWEEFEPGNIQFDLNKMFSFMVSKKEQLEKVSKNILEQNDSLNQIVNLTERIQEGLYDSTHIASIIFSQLHMTFNRLGIYPKLEKKAYPLIEGAIIDETR